MKKKESEEKEGREYAGSLRTTFPDQRKKKIHLPKNASSNTELSPQRREKTKNDGKTPTGRKKEKEDLPPTEVRTEGMRYVEIKMGKRISFLTGEASQRQRRETTL